MKPQKVVIKKYANRRLYDTSGSRYINLEDVAALVRNGKAPFLWSDTNSDTAQQVQQGSIVANSGRARAQLKCRTA